MREDVLGIGEHSFCGRGSLILPFRALAANPLSFFLQGEWRHAAMTSREGDPISQRLLRETGRPIPFLKYLFICLPECVSTRAYLN